MKKTKQSRKCWREGGKEREEDECQRVILELACFPGRRKTQRRSKPQSDKRSQPTNERPNKRTKEQIDFSLLHHRCGFYLTGDVIIISPCVRRDFSPSADQTEGGGSLEVAGRPRTFGCTSSLLLPDFITSPLCMIITNACHHLCQGFDGKKHGAWVVILDHSPEPGL